MAAGTVGVPPFVSQQRGLLSLPVPWVYNLQSSQQLNMDQGHRPAARPRLLRVGAHKYYTSVVSIGTYHNFTLVHFCTKFIFLYIPAELQAIVLSVASWSSLSLLWFVVYLCDLFQGDPVPLDSKGGDRRAAELGSGPCLYWRGLPGALQRPWLLYKWSGLHLWWGTPWWATNSILCSNCYSRYIHILFSFVLVRRKSKHLQQSWETENMAHWLACNLYSPDFITSPLLPLTSTGDDCSLSSSDLPSSIKDNFESGSVSQESWQLIQGGGVGSGCGQLSPHAHGDSLYFNGCKMRQAVTKPLDLTRARYRYYQNILYLN